MRRAVYSLLVVLLFAAFQAPAANRTYGSRSVAKSKGPVSKARPIALHDEFGGFSTERADESNRDGNQNIPRWRCICADLGYRRLTDELRREPIKTESAGEQCRRLTKTRCAVANWDYNRLNMSLCRTAAFFLGGCSLFFGTAPSPSIAGSDTLVGQPAAQHVGPPQLYPNPDLTPGQADTVDVSDLTDRWECPASIHKVDCTYSQAHRSVSTKTHKKVYDEYQVPESKRNAENGEVDHFDPLCNGGSNDIKNLWYQPAKNMWNGKDFGYHAKDDLESWVCTQVKAGKLDPKEAFTRITSDWVKFYMDVNPKHVKFAD